MLFNSLCTDVHFNVFIYYIIVLTKLRLCIVTKIQRFKDFNFLIKIYRIGLHLTFFSHISLSARWKSLAFMLYCVTLHERIYIDTYIRRLYIIYNILNIFPKNGHRSKLVGKIDFLLTCNPIFPVQYTYIYIHIYKWS